MSVLAAAFAIVGVGLGLATGPLLGFAVGRAGENARGAASAYANAARTFGVALVAGALVEGLGRSRRVARLARAGTEGRTGGANDAGMNTQTSSEVTLPEGILRIELPMTGNPLGYINGYVLKLRRGHLLIDCGWDLPDVWEALVAGLEAAGLRIADITDLVCTHFHPDHYGLAGRLKRCAGTRLAMHRLDWDIVRDRLADLPASEAASDEWLARNGLSEATLRAAAIRHEEMKYTLAAPDRLLEDGETLELANGTLRVVWTPGHSPGHLCLHDVEHGALFTGDHILDPITPHVGVWIDAGADPLGEFLTSLAKAKATGATIGAPAHGVPFLDPGRRADELVAHHHVREAAVMAAFDGVPKTAAEIAQALPWTRRQRLFAELSEFHQLFALAETIAHLEHVRRHGRVRRDATHARIIYEPLTR